MESIKDRRSPHLIPIDLQLFSGEKTEEATPKKRQETRQKGQVAKSQEINSSIVLLLSFATLGIAFPFMFQEMFYYSREVFSSVGTTTLSPENISSVFQEMAYATFKIVAPLVFMTMLGGIIANYMQVGVLFTVEPLMIKLERLNPIEGFKKIFSTRSLVELVKSLFKITIVALIAYLVINREFHVFPKMLDMDIMPSAVFIGKLILKVGLFCAVTLFAMAILDYLYQRYEFNKSIRMSKQEVKDEHKNIEGNPQIKGKVREKMRQISMRRMMQDVPKADVVITNPTHYAIALSYDGLSMSAPKVIAKGQDHVALKIKEIAKEHKVVTVENKPLAQALYKSTEVGDFVPPELFQAVAEVLAFVYKLKKKI